MKIGIVGMGLIGGSLARTIKLRSDHTVVACDIDPQTMSLARELNAMDEEMTDGNLQDCSMVFVALYPKLTVDWITSHAHLFGPGTVVIDCAGVKQYVVDAIEPVVRGASWHFIGGHPMAGREFSGFKYTRDDLYDRASMILTPYPDEDPAMLTRVRTFFMDIGFRRVQFTTPVIHDEMIAYTSQLAHIVSSAYVKTPLAKKNKGFSAGSFADMTRVARLNEHMWTELFLENREALLPEVSGLVDRLIAYRDALRDGDDAALLALLREGREVKESLEDNGW